MCPLQKWIWKTVITAFFSGAEDDVHHNKMMCHPRDDSKWSVFLFWRWSNGIPLFLLIVVRWVSLPLSIHWLETVEIDAFCLAMNILFANRLIGWRRVPFSPSCSLLSPSSSSLWSFPFPSVPSLSPFSWLSLYVLLGSKGFLISILFAWRMNKDSEWEKTEAKKRVCEIQSLGVLRQFVPSHHDVSLPYEALVLTFSSLSRNLQKSVKWECETTRRTVNKQKWLCLSSDSSCGDYCFANDLLINFFAFFLNKALENPPVAAPWHSRRITIIHMNVEGLNDPATQRIRVGEGL